jgi:hypothetical protein
MSDQIAEEVAKQIEEMLRRQKEKVHEDMPGEPGDIEYAQELFYRSDVHSKENDPNKGRQLMG